MRRVLLSFALSLVFSGAARAEGDQGQVSLTIYNSDLALVQDVRHLDVPAGRTRLEFKDVSSLIRPETVALSGTGLSVVEQNFDYDLLTPAKMMEKAVGKQVQIVRTVPGTGKETTETATVLSVNEGVVLKIGDRIEVLRDDGIPTRVIFDGIPENLRARPTLSVTVESRSGGARDVTLSYLTRGLMWTADYVAQFDEKANTLALQGWVTLTNNAGVGFSDVVPRLVAGQVGSAPVRPIFRPGINNVANVGGGTGGDAAAEQDFPIYTLPDKVTVADKQTKQVGFLDVSGVAAKKTYTYDANGFASLNAPAHADVRLDFSNTGKALPAGTIRVYERDVDGAPKFMGEERIDHTPAGSDLSVKMGEAFDVTVQPVRVSSERLSDTRTRYRMQYKLRNATGAAATVLLRQHGLGEVSEESQQGKRLDANTQSWQVAVPAHGAADLTFTVTLGG
jgi:hypothetical protein